VVAVPLDGMAVFARAGAAIPLKGGKIRLYPGPASVRELYEDDGETTAYREGGFRRTLMSSRSVDSEGRMEFQLGPCYGNFKKAQGLRPLMILETPVSSVRPMRLTETSLDGVTHVIIDVPVRDELCSSPKPLAEEDPRIIEGCSMHVMAKPGVHASKVCIEVELLRKHPVEGPIKISISANNRTEPKTFKLALGAKPLEILRLDWPLEAGKVEVIDGSLEVQFQSQGREIILNESFHWKATALRDWWVLSPVAAGQGPKPSEFESLPLGAGAWKSEHFTPSSMLRGIREFYDFGETFLCPEGEAWAFTQLHASEAGTVELGFGHEGKGTLWVNGVEMNVQGRSVSTPLKQGPNSIVVRLSKMRRKGGGFGVSVKSFSGELHCRIPKAADLETAGVP
jgi:hypothetical protein